MGSCRPNVFTVWPEGIVPRGDLCPVRVSYEIDRDNNCLNMMRKGVDVTEFSF